MIALQSPGMAAQAGHGRFLYNISPTSQLLLLQSQGYQAPQDVVQAAASKTGGIADGGSDDALLLAHEEYKAGKYQQALGHCHLAHERNPQRTGALVLLGAIYFQLRDYDSCIEKNEAAIRLDPQLAEAYANLANALKEKGSIDLAIQYYAMAVTLQSDFCDAWSNLGRAYMRKGLWQQAADCCRNAIAINPRQVDAHTNLGNILKAQGFFQKAYACYLDALHVDPNSAMAWSNLAGLFMESGDYPRAYVCYQEALRLKPTFADAYVNQGNVLKAMGRTAEALVSYQNAIQLRPSFAMAYGNLGSIYYEQGLLDLAILHYRQALTFDPSFSEAYNNLGNALKDSGRAEEALSCYQSCLALQPHHPQALTNLGNMYLEWSMLTEASTFYRHAIAVTTGLAAPYSNLATIYKQQGQYGDAITCYNESLRIQPMAADTLVNRGNTLKEMGRVSEAIQDYARAVAIRPTMAEAHANLASAYKDSGHAEAAIVSYQQALVLRSDFPEASCNLLHTLQCVCDWENRDAKFVELEGIIRRQIDMRLLPSVQPFHAIAYPIDPLLALDISKKYAEHCTLLAARSSLPPFKHPGPVPIKAPGGSGRLKIGYVSSDFGNHPLSHLMGSVFGLHTRASIEVYCYALSANDGSEWRVRISSETEHFLDVSAMTSGEIAARIAADEIQVLVNLNGYTKGARNEIFAMKPAPVQISYMGFPGTTGADYIHYLVTDEIVSPQQYAHIYSEKLVYLPHCYFVNDYKQRNLDVLEGNPLKRSSYGLPEDKFLFACFNQLYKMDPEIFITWCNILKRVPNSALWLLRFPAAGENRVRKFAAAQGVKPEQIIFTDVAAKTEHIKRSALADLFLDTPLCNAHTTGTDVLWAGLPMVTLPLEKMATRVAMSLCHAAGCGKEMVASDMKEYEEMAVYYATNPAALQAVRRKLEAGRTSCPLFDTHRWVKNLERGYYKMWDLYCKGQHPQPFKVVEDDDEFPPRG